MPAPTISTSKCSTDADEESERVVLANMFMGPVLFRSAMRALDWISVKPNDWRYNASDQPAKLTALTPIGVRSAKSSPDNASAAYPLSARRILHCRSVLWTS